MADTVEVPVTTIAPPDWLTSRVDRKRWEALHRRLNWLEHRMPHYRGDPSRALAEAGALRWALRTIASIER